MTTFDSLIWSLALIKYVFYIALGLNGVISSNSNTNFEVSVFCLQAFILHGSSPAINFMRIFSDFSSKSEWKLKGQRARALSYLKIDPIVKMYATFHSGLNLYVIDVRRYIA